MQGVSIKNNSGRTVEVHNLPLATGETRFLGFYKEDRINNIEIFDVSSDVIHKEDVFIKQYPVMLELRGDSRGTLRVHQIRQVETALEDTPGLNDAEKYYGQDDGSSKFDAFGPGPVASSQTEKSQKVHTQSVPAPTAGQAP